MKKLWWVLVICLPLSGCLGQDTYEKTHKTLSVSKETAIFIATTAKDLHYNGVIDDIKLSKVRDAYERISKAQDLLIDAQIASLEGKEDSARTKALHSVYVRAMTEFVSLALEIGIISAGDAQTTPAIRPRPSVSGPIF